MKLPVTVLAFVCASLFIAGCGQSGRDGEFDGFAQCLAASGVTMYGGFQCPHCRQMKKSFGSSWEYVNYVECDPRGPDEQSLRCIDKGIDAYPTWELANGTHVEGAIPLSELSALTGCPLYASDAPATEASTEDNTKVNAAGNALKGGA
ncbi:MAG: hypothetical protein GXP63_06080 [DPANN group archaeon]|nr:hypothetical protein [DPANN group archaeon]